MAKLVCLMLAILILVICSEHTVYSKGRHLKNKCGCFGECPPHSLKRRSFFTQKLQQLTVWSARADSFHRPNKSCDRFYAAFAQNISMIARCCRMKYCRRHARENPYPYLFP